MPESVRDRLNCRHELIFLLVKQPAYWFDLDPIRVPHATVRPACASQAAPRGTSRRTSTGTRRPPRGPAGGTHPGGTRPPKYGPHSREVIAARRYGTGRHRRGHPRGRNPGDVWPPRPLPRPALRGVPSTSRCAASPRDASQAARY